MASPVGVGVPFWPEVGSSWDWWPLVMVPAAFAIARIGLRIPMTPRAIAFTVVGGTVWAYTVTSWGVPLALGTGIVATLVLRRALPR